MRRTYCTLNDSEMQHNVEVGLFTKSSIFKHQFSADQPGDHRSRQHDQAEKEEDDTRHGRCLQDAGVNKPPEHQDHGRDGHDACTDDFCDETG